MSPLTPEQLESLKENRREQILNAAFRLFSKKGYYHTSISDIAMKAKLYKGLLYNYLESKEVLLNEVLTFAFRGVSDLGDDVMEKMKDMPADEIFKIIITSYFTMMKEQVEVMNLTLSLAVQVSAIPSVHDTILKFYDDLLKQLEYILNNMGYAEPKKEAMLLGAIVDGIGIQYLLDINNYPIEEMKEMIINK